MIDKIVLVLILMLSVPAGATTVSLNTSASEVYAGNTFDVDVIVDTQSANVAGVSIEAGFDPVKLELVSVNEGNLLNQDGAKTLFNPGRVNVNTVTDIWGVISENASMVNPGTFAVLTFRAISEGSAVLELKNVKISEPTGNLTSVIILNTQTIQVISNDSTILPTTSGTSGGEGGGAGGAQGENYTNIELNEKYDLFIFKDITTPYSFIKEANPIRFINITGNTDAGEINTAVEVLRATSTLINIPAEKMVFRNLNIRVGTFGFATPGNIKDAEITFRVPISWLVENNIHPDSVKMMRFDKAWYPLTTQNILGDITYIYYQANTTGFGGFAITGKESIEKISWPEYINVIQPGEKTREGAAQQTIMPGGSEEISPTSMILLIIIFIELIANFILWRKLTKK